MKVITFALLFATWALGQTLPAIPSFDPISTSSSASTTEAEKSSAAMPVLFSSSSQMSLEKIEKEKVRDLNDLKMKKDWLSEEMASISSEIAKVKSEEEMKMLPLQPKGEFERQSDFEVRQSAWFTQREERWIKATTPLINREERLKKAEKKLTDESKNLVAKIEITANIDTALLFINGMAKGNLPYKTSDLPAGQYQFRAEKKGYENSVFDLNVIGGKSYEKEFVLKKLSIFPSAIGVSLDSIAKANYKSESSILASLDFLKDLENSVQADYDSIKALRLSNVKPLTPKGEFERSEDFEKRKTAYEQKNQSQLTDINVELSKYKERVGECRAELQQKKMAWRYTTETLAITASQINWNTYNADAEKLPLKIEVNQPGHKAVYKGFVLADIPLAKKLKSDSASLSGQVEFYRWQEEVGGSKYYVAYKELSLKNGVVPLKLEGNFELDQSLAKDSNVIAAQNQIKNGMPSEKSSWYKSPVLRWGLLALGAGLGAYAVVVDRDIQSKVDEFSPNSAGEALSKQKEIRDREKLRNQLIGASLGVFAIDIVLWTF